MLVAALTLLVLLAAALAVAVRIRPARRHVATPASSWTHAAGAEFEGLSDAERCDLIFAVAAIGDEASEHLLHRALDDPCEAVALAAARALTNLGQTASVHEYLDAHRDERGRRIAATIELLR